MQRFNLRVRASTSFPTKASATRAGVWLGLGGLALSSAGCHRDAELTPEPSLLPAAPALAVAVDHSSPTPLPGRATYLTGSRHAAARPVSKAAEALAPAITPLAMAAPAVAKEQVAATPKPSAPPETLLRVARLVVTNSIEHREPLLPSTLALGAPVVAFIELENSAGLPQKIRVTFEPEGGTPVGNVELPVPAGRKRWRTWAQTRHVQRAGSWRVLVRAESGQLLAETKFTLGAAHTAEVPAIAASAAVATAAQISAGASQNRAQ